MEDAPRAILLIEDDETLRNRFSSTIEESGYGLVVFPEPHGALRWLRDNTPFLIVLGYRMKGMTGEEFIVELKQLGLPVPPFIVSTSPGEECMAGEMMKLGARDYNVRDRNLVEMTLMSIWRVSREIDNENRLKQAEEKLRCRESYLSAIVENQPGRIWMKDLSGRYLMANTAFARACGLAGADMVIGKTDSDLWPPEVAQRYRSHDMTVINSRSPLRVEEKLTDCGSDRWFEIHILPISDANGNALGTTGFCLDITDRKVAELTIAQQNQMLQKLNSDKDKFLSILAHDLKTPFTALIGYTDLLASNLKKYDSEKIEKRVNIINEYAKQFYRLLDDTLTWARSQSGKIPFDPQMLNFRRVCNDVVDTMLLSASGKNISLQVSSPPELFVLADLNMLKAILRNLVSNAIKFTNSGGRVAVAASQGNGTVVITVSDNGIGIAEEGLARIWDFSRPYTTSGTANEKGTGLGLLLCKEFVDKHMGTIDVKSELNVGTTFTVTLPMPKKEETNSD
jgi:PAS domain S-box-containing protein